MSTFKKYVYINDHYLPFNIKSKAPDKYRSVKYIDQESMEFLDGVVLNDIKTKQIKLSCADGVEYVDPKDVIKYDRTLDPEFRIDDLMAVVPVDEVEQTLEESGYETLVAIESGFGFYWIFDEPWD